MVVAKPRNHVINHVISWATSLRVGTGEMCFKQRLTADADHSVRKTLLLKDVGAAARAGESEANKTHGFHFLLLRSFTQMQAGCIATNLFGYRVWLHKSIMK